MTLPAHKSLRRVALLHPIELPLVVCLLLVAVVFTVFPQALEHAPVSFEQRGLVHHAWHYSLLMGAGLAAFGLFTCDIRRGRLVQVAGFTLLVAALAMNLVALIAAETSGDPRVDLSGLTIAIRVALIIGLLTRMWITAAQPTIVFTGSRDA